MGLEGGEIWARIQISVSPGFLVSSPRVQVNLDGAGVGVTHSGALPPSRAQARTPERVRYLCAVELKSTAVSRVF